MRVTSEQKMTVPCKGVAGFSNVFKSPEQPQQTPEKFVNRIKKNLITYTSFLKFINAGKRIRKGIKEDLERACEIITEQEEKIYEVETRNKRQTKAIRVSHLTEERLEKQITELESDLHLSRESRKDLYKELDKARIENKRIRERLKSLQSKNRKESK